MKRLLYVLCLLFILNACTESNSETISIDSEVIGSWLLIEIYLDPGDGSGDFVPVSSEKIVSFESNGTVTSNGNLCFISPESEESSSGTFSETNNTISIPSCTFVDQSLTYEVNEDDNLIIYHPCIEGCLEKYVRVEE